MGKETETAMYIRLSHARSSLQSGPDTSTDRDLVFGPLQSVDGVFNHDIKLSFTNINSYKSYDVVFYCLYWDEDCLYYDGVYYSDYHIFMGERAKMESDVSWKVFNQKLAYLPKENSGVSEAPQMDAMMEEEYHRGQAVFDTPMTPDKAIE